MFWTKNTPKKFVAKSVRDALEKNFTAAELDELTRHATLVDVAAGTTLTVQGTRGQQALILVDGMASVVRNGESVATINPGEIIGEIALLSGEPRTATVVTETSATVYALSPREFASLLARCPRLGQRFASVAIRRATATV